MLLLTYPAVGITGSPIDHAAKPGQETTDGFAQSFCGVWISVEHLSDNEPLRAVTAEESVRIDPEHGVVGQRVCCLRCSAAVDRWYAARGVSA